MYFFPLNTIPMLVCPYLYKKRWGKKNRKTIITKTLADLGTSTRLQNLPFLCSIEWLLVHQVFFQIVFFYKQFYDFPKVPLHGNLILSLEWIPRRILHRFSYKRFFYFPVFFISRLFLYK